MFKREITRSQVLWLLGVCASFLEPVISLWVTSNSSQMIPSIQIPSPAFLHASSEAFEIDAGVVHATSCDLSEVVRDKVVLVTSETCRPINLARHCSEYACKAIVCACGGAIKEAGLLAWAYWVYRVEWNMRPHSFANVPMVEISLEDSSILSNEMGNNKDVHVSLDKRDENPWQEFADSWEYRVLLLINGAFALVNLAFLLRKLSWLIHSNHAVARLQLVFPDLVGNTLRATLLFGVLNQGISFPLFRFLVKQAHSWSLMSQVTFAVVIQKVFIRDCLSKSIRAQRITRIFTVFAIFIMLLDIFMSILESWGTLKFKSVAENRILLYIIAPIPVSVMYSYYGRRVAHVLRQRSRNLSIAECSRRVQFSKRVKEMTFALLAYDMSLVAFGIVYKEGPQWFWRGAFAALLSTNLLAAMRLRAVQRRDNVQKCSKTNISAGGGSVVNGNMTHTQTHRAGSAAAQSRKDDEVIVNYSRRTPTAGTPRDDVRNHIEQQEQQESFGQTGTDSNEHIRAPGIAGADISSNPQQ